MNIKPEFIVRCLAGALRYIPVTLFIAGMTLFIGFVMGTVTALLRVHRIPVLSWLCDLYVIVLKAIPTNLLLIAIDIYIKLTFNQFAQRFGLNMTVREVNTIYVGIAALSFSATAMLSENIRGALLSIDKGQYEGAYTIGMTRTQVFRHVIFPQLMLVLVPPMTGTIIGIIQSTSLVIVIGVVDIMNGALKYANIAYCFFEAYLAAALIYWFFSVAIQYLGRLAEKQLGRYRKELF